MTRTKKLTASRDRMLEIVVETYLVELVEAHGGLCEKHVSPGRRGPPDRLVTWPVGLDLVECKAPGEKPRKDQQRDHARRAQVGQKEGFVNKTTRVYLIDTKAKADAYCSWRIAGLVPQHLFSPYV